MEGVTRLADGHRHLFSNVTDRLIRTPGMRHRHTFQAITNTTENHRHAYSGTTGPAIGQGANHFHRFQFLTRIADGHRHLISGRTTVPIRIGGVMTHGLIIEKVKTIKV